MASNAPPTTQKACIVAQGGRPPTSLEFRSDWPVPTKVPEGRVLIKVQAGALNPVGVKFMRMLPNFIAKRPHIAEYDVTGTVVDANGTQFAVGDAVFGVVLPLDTMKTRQGALAQYVTVSSTWLASRPDNVTATEASGLAIAGLTALNAFQKAKLERGQTVFINGGSSSVGAFTIQVAKANGCRVVASASGPNEEFVRNLGADEFIDYTAQPLAQYLASNPPSPKFHAIIDAVGLRDPSLYILSPSFLDPNGVFVTSGALPRDTSWKEMGGAFRQLVEGYLRPRWLGGVRNKYVMMQFEAPDELKVLREMVAQGTVKPVVDSVWPFDDEGVKSAYERLMSDRAKGKVVVEVDTT